MTTRRAMMTGAAMAGAAMPGRAGREAAASQEWQATAVVGTKAPGFYKLRLGDMVATLVHDDTAHRPLDEGFVHKADLEEVRSARRVPARRQGDDPVHHHGGGAGRPARADRCRRGRPSGAHGGCLDEQPPCRRPCAGGRHGRGREPFPRRPHPGPAGSGGQGGVPQRGAFSRPVRGPAVAAARPTALPAPAARADGGTSGG